MQSSHEITFEFTRWQQGVRNQHWSLQPEYVVGSSQLYHLFIPTKQNQVLFNQMTTF